jgi:hypothetical protein
MKELRVKICQIISDNYQFGNRSLAETADAILALPDMKAPTDVYSAWKEWQKEASEARIVKLQAALLKEAEYHDEEAECLTAERRHDAVNYHIKRAAKIREALKERI